MSNEASGAVCAAVRELCWTGTELANRAGVSEYAAALILHGDVPEDEGTYRKIVVALLAGLSRLYLFELESDSQTASVADMEAELLVVMTADGAELDPDVWRPDSATWLLPRNKIDPLIIPRLTAGWVGQQPG
jgi:transcriptional regulator with XRE-family HTH domain